MNDDAAPGPVADELIEFFRVLSDRSRLSMVALLQEREWMVEELAEAVRISPATCSHHLRRLEAIGLVGHEALGTYRRYRLDAERLTALRRTFLSDGALKAAGWPADFDARVLGDFVDPAGRLRSLPAQRKKRAVIIAWLAERFSPGRRYGEAEVNAVLKDVYPEDVATLRRELIAFRFMARQDGVYWRVVAPPVGDGAGAAAEDAGRR